jgi:hypothetical protein
VSVTNNTRAPVGLRIQRSSVPSWAPAPASAEPAGSALRGSRSRPSGRPPRSLAVVDEAKVQIPPLPILRMLLVDAEKPPNTLEVDVVAKRAGVAVAVEEHRRPAPDISSDASPAAIRCCQPVGPRLGRDKSERMARSPAALRAPAPVAL